MDEHLELARRYFEFFNNPKGTVEELRDFLSSEIIWQEMPNQFAPNGRTSDYNKMLTNFQIGQKFVTNQSYRIDQAVAQGDTVAVQLSWQGTVAQTIGPFAAGSGLKCQIASFLQFRDGKLIRQIDYPCYLPVTA